MFISEVAWYRPSHLGPTLIMAYLTLGYKKYPNRNEQIPTKMLQERVMAHSLRNTEIAELHAHIHSKYTYTPNLLTAVLIDIY